VDDTVKLPFLAPKGLGQYCSFNFDSGSLDRYVLVDSTPTIRIEPKYHWNSEWLWFAVRSKSWAGKTPHFLINKADRFSTPTTEECQAVWSTSPDTNTWYKFANQAVGATDIEFYHDSAFPSGMIYVAYLPLYPFSRVQRKVTEWASSDPRVTDTPSSTNFILGYTTARDNGDGRTVPALPYYAFMITNENENTKNNMVLTAGNHPSETIGNFQLEGAVNWLLDGSPEAELILDWFNVYVYPCVNPQGRWGGWFRSCPEDATRDHNREWDDTALEDVHAFRDAMAADTGSTIEVSIDFHASAGDTNGYMWAVDHTSALYANWLAKMIEWQANFTYADNNYSTMLTQQWMTAFSSKLSITCEYGANHTDGIAEWVTQGEYAMLSIEAMLLEDVFTNGPAIVQVGSYDFNGSTDRIDWASVQNLVGTPVSVSSWVKLDGFTTPNDYIFHAHASGNTNYALLVSLVGTSTIQFVRNGATILTKAGYTVALGSTWHHILVTHDGVITTHASAHVYIDNTECTTYVNEVNGATEVAPAGSWSVGGRIYDDTRNFDGHICQVAVWDRVVNSTERASLAAGYAPDVAAPTDLIFYWKGNTDSEVASPGGNGTADGTTYVADDGPTIIYE
jgi:hypothetical protein